MGQLATCYMFRSMQHIPPDETHSFKPLCRPRQVLLAYPDCPHSPLEPVSPSLFLQLLDEEVIGDYFRENANSHIQSCSTEEMVMFSRCAPFDELPFSRAFRVYKWCVACVVSLRKPMMRPAD